MRPHITFWIGLFAHGTCNLEQMWYKLREGVENGRTGEVITVGLLWMKGPEKKGWNLAQKTSIPVYAEMLKAALAIAACQNGLDGITTIRFGRGVKEMKPQERFTHSELWMWASTQGA